MTVNSLMVKQTQSQSNTWRWICWLWHVLHYELWMINHRESILLQFSLALVTTKFIDTKSVSREPGGYKCKTAIWDIHNLCAFDVVICKKKLQRNFNGLEAEKGEKNLWDGCLALFFPSESLLHQKENKKFLESNKFSHWACNHWEKKEFHLLISMLYWSGGSVLISSITWPEQWPATATLSNSVNKGKLFPFINVLPHEKDRDW